MRCEFNSHYRRIGCSLIGKIVISKIIVIGSNPIALVFILFFTPIAQLVELLSVKQRVIGSIPVWCVCLSSSIGRVLV